MICKNCSNQCVKTGHNQKYCPDCRSVVQNKKNSISCAVWRKQNNERYKKQRLSYLKTEKGREMIRMAWRTARLKYPEKHNARQALKYAVLTGKIVKPSSCTICKNKPVQGHHEDYSKPLTVIWLCQKCHTLIHKK
jgi:hypothetical protein